MTLLLLRLLHLLGMTLWFGGAIFANSDMRRSFANPTEIPGLRGRMKRAGIVSTVGAVATLATGFGLIFATGGMGAVPVPIHIGMTLGLILAGVGGAIAMAWSGIETTLDAGQPPEAALPLVKRIRVLGAVFHALWFVTLCLMVFRNAGT